VLLKQLLEDLCQQKTTVFIIVLEMRFFTKSKFSLFFTKSTKRKVPKGKYQRDFFHKKYQKGFFLAFHSNCFVFLTAITSGRAGASRSALPGGTLRIRLGLTGRGSQARQGLLPSPFALEDKGVMQIATAAASKKMKKSLLVLSFWYFL
jgi:hypothetical protein